MNTLQEAARAAACTLAPQYYSRLPISLRQTLDLEDLISIGLLFFLEREHKYDASKAAPITFAYVTMHTAYRHYVRDTLRIKRNPRKLVSLADLSRGEAARVERQSPKNEYADVAGLLNAASEGLRDVLSNLSASSRRDVRKYRVELQELAQRFGVDRMDLADFVL